MKATERQKYLLELAGNNQLMFQTAFESWSLSLSAWNATTGLYGTERHLNRPSKPEGKTLLAQGWIELVENRKCWTEDTKTKKRIYDKNAILTDAGRKALEGK